MVGGEGDDQLAEWTWCHCWVPLQGAIVVCYGGEGEGDEQLWGSGRSIAGCPWHLTQQWHPEKTSSCLDLLADVTLFSTLMTQKLVFAIWGLCWYNFSSG